MISVGSPAPLFTVQDQNGTPFSLSTYKGKHNVLLLFLPAAFTPICSTELPALAVFQSNFFQEANTIVAAVTTDNSPANREWARRCSAENIFLLSDAFPHGKVSALYGALLQNEGLSDRATVIIDCNGIVQYAESVGKFGKRSIPKLLEVAKRIAGVPCQPVQSVSMPLDLPILFLTQSCPHCKTVKHMIQDLHAEDKVVVKQVDTDQAAMRQLLTLHPEAPVPLLAWQGMAYMGPHQIGPTLQVIAASRGGRDAFLAKGPA